MASIQAAYAASSNLTITLASLASSSAWLAGQQSSVVDNTSNLYLDYHLSGRFRVGTSPTSGTEIRVYVVGLLDDSTWPDVFTGAGDAAKTVTAAGVGTGFLKLAATMLVDSTTSSRDYYFGPVSVRNLFGGVLPAKFLVFVTHNTGVAADSTGGNFQVTTKGEYATSA